MGFFIFLGEESAFCPWVFLGQKFKIFIVGFFNLICGNFEILIVRALNHFW